MSFEQIISANTRVQAVPGDDTCLFHCFALGINERFGTHLTGAEIREILCNFLEHNGEYVVDGYEFQQWLFWFEKQSIPEYVARMRSPTS